MQTQNNTVFITEGSAHSGRAIATHFAQVGATVILGGPDLRKLSLAKQNIIDHTGNSQVHTCLIDINSLASIKKATEHLKSEFMTLDTLIHNTDRLYFSQKYTQDGFEAHFGHNFLAPMAITLDLMSTLKQNQPSKIFLFAADIYYCTEPPFIKRQNQAFDIYHHYSESKLSALMLSRILNQKLSGSSVSTFALDTLNSSQIHNVFQLCSHYAKSHLTNTKKLVKSIAHITHARQITPFKGCLIRNSKPTWTKQLSKNELLCDKLWTSSLRYLNREFLDPSLPSSQETEQSNPAFNASSLAF